MIDPDLDARLKALEEKIERAMRAAESTRRWMFWTGVITVALIVLPLIGFVFVIPLFINNYVAPIQNLLSTTP